MTPEDRPARAFQLTLAVSQLLSDAIRDDSEFSYNIRRGFGNDRCDIHITIAPAKNPVCFFVETEPQPSELGAATGRFVDASPGALNTSDGTRPPAPVCPVGSVDPVTGLDEAGVPWERCVVWTRR